MDRWTPLQASDSRRLPDFEKFKKSENRARYISGLVELIVCATTVKNRRVLLVRHAGVEKPDYGDWLLPAGSVEGGESLEQALKREMKEETGLRIRVIRKLVELIDSYTNDVLVNFLCIPLTSKIKISSELMETKWFDLNEIQRLKNIHPGLKQFLIDGFNKGSFRE